MRKLLVLLMSLVMILAMAVPVSAVGEKIYVVDKADKITLASEADLNANATVFAEKYGVDIVFMDVTGADSAIDLAKSLKEDYSKNSIIMVHNVDTNKVGTVAYGKVKDVIDEDAINEIFEVYNGADTYKKGVEEYQNLVQKKLLASGEFKDKTATGTEDFTEPASDIESAVNPGEDVQTTEPKSIPDHRIKDRLVDDADLLTRDEEKTILKKLNAMSEEKQMDVVVYFTDSFSEPTVIDAADDYYDYNGFGYGPDREGIVMFVCMDTRDIYFSTCGPNTIGYFTDSKITDMVSKVGPYLTNGEYAQACEEYMELVDYNTTKHFSFGAMIAAILAFFGIGVGTGSAKVSSGRRQLVSVAFKGEANSYLRQGSYNLKHNNATYITTDVTRIYDPLPKNNGGGGGSSTHMSSSGSFHGGGGGKF